MLLKCKCVSVCVCERVYSLVAAAFPRQDGTNGRSHRDAVRPAVDDGGSQQRLELPPTQRHLRVTASRRHFGEKLKRTRSSPSPRCDPRGRPTGCDVTTSVMTGAHESSFHCKSHSCCLEQNPEHQPQFMKREAIRHMGQVLKCAHPGPREGTLNI